MNALVSKLCEGEHPLMVSRANNSKEFKERIDRGYLLLKFTKTDGGTEIGVRLELANCNFDDADFTRGTGKINIVGHLNLDFNRVRCSAELDICKLTGVGRLEKLD